MKRYRKIFWIFLILYFIYFLSFIPGYILLDVIPYKVLGNTPDESSKYPGEDVKAQNGNNFKENIDAQGCVTYPIDLSSRYDGIIHTQ